MFKAPPFSCRQGWPLIAAALAGLMLLSCSHSEAKAATPAKRILSLGPALTEMLFALNLGDRVVGVDSYSNYPAAARKKPVVGGAVDLNDEQVLATRPDLILSVEGDRAHLQRLSRLTGARLVVLETHHVKDIWSNLHTIGSLTGSEARAASLTSSLQARLKRLTRPTGATPSVFYMVWDKPLMTAGADSYLNDLITLAGGHNIASDARGGAYPTYSWELLLARDPEVVLGPQNLQAALGGLSQRYPNLRAVRTRHVRSLPDDLISRPGPRVVEALAAVEGALK